MLSRPADRHTSSPWLLGIGIDRYAEFPHLHNAVKDLTDVTEILVERYGFSKDRVIHLIDSDAIEENVIDQLEKLVNFVAGDESILIYFSGHGHYNKQTQIGYWIPYDARRGVISTYISNSTVRDYIRVIPSKHTLLISDSCFSGSLLVRGEHRGMDIAAEELGEIPSRWAICSGRHDEQVYDGKPGTNSPFARSILGTLRDNADPLLRVALLSLRVVSETRANYKQLPEGSPLFDVGHKGGEMIFRMSESWLWGQATEANTVEAFKEFLAAFPNSSKKTMAIEKTLELTRTKKPPRSTTRHHPEPPKDVTSSRIGGPPERTHGYSKATGDSKEPESIKESTGHPRLDGGKITLKKQKDFRSNHHQPTNGIFRRLKQSPATSVVLASVIAGAIFAALTLAAFEILPLEPTTFSDGRFAYLEKFGILPLIGWSVIGAAVAGLTRTQSNLRVTSHRWMFTLLIPLFFGAVGEVSTWYWMHWTKLSVDAVLLSGTFVFPLGGLALSIMLRRTNHLESKTILLITLAWTVAGALCFLWWTFVRIPSGDAQQYPRIVRELIPWFGIGGFCAVLLGGYIQNYAMRSAIRSAVKHQSISMEE